uniref:Retrovirus-related Pol polyprotein from transposon TNT 1-94 n=1 Tax=Tanacetum cinerariifolium TaxID=118510 RepID=A0A6L2NHC2_TANCI|nr:retrovirus-related Pol polyprotein from transposon TNT 1-94 [Tanacetum cinerariifolium]
MAKATSSQAWLWHRRLSHLNFDTINLLSKNDFVIGLPKLKFVKDHLCSSYELGKAKQKSFQTKTTPSSKRRLQLLHMDLCGLMRVASINGKRIVDDYSRYTWTHFLRSKDETPEVLIDFLRLVQRGLHAQVRIVRTDKGTEFLNQTLHAYIDNDIYSTVDACPNACEMWKAIERLKQGESINVQDFETNLFWEFGKFTSQDGESLESYYSRFYKMMNEITSNQCKVTNHQVNVQFLLQLQPEWQRTQQAATRNRGKAIANSPQPIYDQEPSMVDDDDETSKDKEIDKLMALISLSFKKIYKPTNNNLQTSSNTSRENQDNSPRIHRNAGYEHQRLGNVAGAREL